MKFFVTIFLLTIFSFAANAQKGGEAPGRLPATRQVVHFFPNPATSVINFEFKAEVSRGSALQVYNFLGRKMANTPLNNAQRITMNISDFVRGIYVFQLVDAAGRIIETNKFQVTR